MHLLKKHLNWTAIIITIGGLLLSIILLCMGLGFNLFPRPHLLATEFKIGVALSVFGAALGSIAGMLWVIGRKHLNTALAVFFVPAGLSPLILLLALFPGLLFSQYFYWGESYLPPYLILVLELGLLATVLWIIGVIILLLAKDKAGTIFTKKEDAASEIKAENAQLRPVRAARHIPPGVLLRIGIVVLLAAVMVAGFSGSRINSGYQSWVIVNHSTPPDEKLHYSQFSFESPRSYFTMGGGEMVRYPGDEITILSHRIRPLYIATTGIQINISPSIMKEGNPVFPSLVEQCIYFYCQSRYGWWPVGDNIEVQNLKIGRTAVAGISADYASFYTDFPQSYVGSTRNEVKLVCFKREGNIWTIRMATDRERPHIVNSDFEKLINSIRITD
jgi:hypothetical protein